VLTGLVRALLVLSRLAPFAVWLLACCVDEVALWLPSWGPGLCRGRGWLASSCCCCERRIRAPPGPYSYLAVVNQGGGFALFLFRCTRQCVISDQCSR